MRLRLLAAFLAMLATAGCIDAQIQHPPETTNAALRYWMAFAEMQDVPADKATQQLLEKMVSGETPWDQNKVAPVLDANRTAIQIMQRATQLPECDWGLEYDEGPRASIAYAPRARALARLNTLEGMHQLAAGDPQAAVDTWLAGLRFSQDLARRGSLIFALMAKASLLSDLRALKEAAANGKLSDGQKKQVLAAVRALPESGFDWGEAWGIEGATVEQFLHELQTATNPGETYQAMMGSASPKAGLPPTAQEVRTYDDYMLAVQSALREPPDKTKTLLDRLESKRATLTEAEQNIAPNPQKVNQARIEIKTARTELLQVLAKE
jgi:hypothetical protein